jgi:uncharacterized membrane protein YgcG
MRTKVLFILSLLLFGNVALAQNTKIFGKIYDSESNSPLPAANITLINAVDTSLKLFVESDISGSFSFAGMQGAKYKLKIAFIGYKTVTTDVPPDKAYMDLGIIKIQPNAVSLKSINIQGEQTRVEQIGDTTQYHAGAYKTKSDATAEDLVTKMPGITITNGAVKSQNENVQQVLVDGKPYFGEDPSIALKSLPADVIDKIQVFDKLSDQAQFTGFDDGNSSKTINIITKTGRNNGQFGKIYGGYGTDDHYLAGGYINYFKGDERVSLIGMSNNINQQNFSSQDLLGIQGSSGRRGGGFSGGMPRGGGGSYSGGSSNNFLVNQQSGISSTNSIGLNYTDSWSSKINVTASYFFNNTDNNNVSKLTRNYILNPLTGQIYDENNSTESNNFNHRLNARFEYNMDSANSIIFTPKLYLQKNNGSNNAIGSYLSGTDILSNSFNNYSSDNSGYTSTNNILYRHKFNKKGRTISFNIEADVNDKTGNGVLASGDSSFIPVMRDTVSNQKSTASTSGYTLGANLAYTEPIGTNSQLQINYSPSLSKNVSDNRLFDRDSLTQEYNLLDTSFSNKFNNNYITQKSGLSYHYRKDKLNISAGINYQYAELTGDQTFPENGKVNRYFSNILPNAMFIYRFSKTSNLRINYRASTSAPSITQLQNVVDNSNPMMLTSGNPDLDQQYVQTVFGNYSKTNVAKGRTFMVFAFASYTNNYIGNSVIHAFKDTIISDVHLYQGAQLSRLANLDNSWNLRSFFTYGFPLNFMKCNLNLHTGFQYNTIPGLIDGIKNTASTYSVSQGLVLSSNISEKVDFTISYTANYNIAQNTLQKENNNNYFSHLATVKLNWIIWKGFFVGGDATQYLYSGLTQKYNQNFFLVDPYIGTKLFKNQNGEIKILAYDILKQNKSISRNVTESYIEDSQTNLLQRYFMLMFTYNIKKYKGANNKSNYNQK